MRYQGYKNRIPTCDLEAQVDELLELDARKIAAAALGVDWNFAFKIHDEMDSRLQFAFKQWIDNEGCYDE